MRERYVVVRDAKGGAFTRWHEKYEEAKEEAARLCKKEQIPFIILKEVAWCIVEEVPITWHEYTRI